MAGGTRLRLRVKAGARRAGLLGVHDGALKLAVTTAPEKGKANRSVLKLLARTLELEAGSIEILTGQTSQDKTILVPLPTDVLERRVAAALAS